LGATEEKTMKESKKAKWSIEKAIFHGKEALKLALDHRADIEPRLDPGEIDSLQSGLERLEAMETGRPAKVTEVKGLTGSQEDIAEKGHAWVAAIRKAVKNRAEGSGLAKAVGVGLPALKARAKTVATAIEAILTAAKERPSELRACGVLDKDLAKGQAILSAIQGARSIKDDGMTEKKEMTRLKDATQISVEKAVTAISAMGNLEYHDANPALAQQFLDIIPTDNGGNETPPAEPPAPEKRKA
jgi:hypothetical protein